MSKETRAIIVGAAQFTQNKEEAKPLDPLRLMVKTSQLAKDDTGVADLFEKIDAVYVTNIITWPYKNAPKELSEILGIKPEQTYYPEPGGEIPQLFVNRAAKAIASGKSKAVLMTGAEAIYTRHRSRLGNITLDWPERREPEHIDGEKWKFLSDFEYKYELQMPSNSYAMLETALRAASGRGLKEHRTYMGKLYERFSIIASKNPHSWIRESYTAEEITTPTPKNRYICHPYTKRMTSNPYVDQSATLIMTSENIAEKLGIEKKKWVYLMGGADLKNIVNITRRPLLYDSPALREASHIALKQAGISLEDVNKFDLYSCFPCMVEIARQELKIPEDDPRDLTLSGGLSFFGGPYNNYSMHAIVSAVNLIREKNSLKIMIVANGGYNTKQSIGIYSMEPPALSWNNRDDTAVQQQIFAKELPEPIEKADGLLTIEAYTIKYDRSGNPTEGIVIGRLENGCRTLAIIDADPNMLLKLEHEELVGKAYKVYYNSDKDRNLICI